MMTRKFLRPRVAAMVGIAALLGAYGRPVAAVQATLAADGYVVLGATAKTGAKTTLKVVDPTKVADRSTTAFVRFDLSVLPGTVTTAQIAKATLRLYVSKLTVPGAVDVSMVTTATSWSDADIGPVTPTVGSPVTTDTAVTGRYAWVSIDVTSAVKGWLTTPANNYGLAIGPTSSSGIKAEFDSKESLSTSQAPQLEIVLSSAGPGSIASADINFSTSTGTGNSAVGDAALFSNTTGGDNTAVGGVALWANTTGYLNTAVGFTALTSNDTGFDNTAVGAAALGFNSSGDRNTAVGNGALEANTTGSRNTALGNGALSMSTTAPDNTAVGNHALNKNDSGYNNTAVGSGTLGANTAGGLNTAVGAFALMANTTGGFNTAIGEAALYTNDTGSHNTALGFAALNLSTGDNNTAVGDSALDANTTGINNSALGSGALGLNTTGTRNVAVGNAALKVNDSGQYNTAIGYDALVASLGDSNTALGRQALQSVTTGASNVGIGDGAGSVLSTGSNNIYIGTGVWAGSNSEANVTRIGTTSGTATYIGGIYGPTVSTRAVYVNSAGQLGTLSSSRRFKTDIHPIGGMSHKLLQLRPVSFRYKKAVEANGAVQYGLIAEEVATVFPDLVELGSDGKPYTVRYHLLSALLLNEFQKQHAALEQVRVENAQLRAQVEEIGALKARLAAVEAALPAVDGRPALHAAAAREY